MGSGSSGKWISIDDADIEDVGIFRTIVDSIPSGVFIFQGDVMRYVNPSAEFITGYTKDELLAKPFYAIVHEDSMEMIKQRGRSRQAGSDEPDDYEVQLVRKCGETRWYNARLCMIDFAGKPAAMGVVEDINERKLAEKSVRKLSQAIEQAGDPILITDRDGVTEYANSAFMKLTGYTSEESVGQIPEILKNGNQDAVIYKDIREAIASGEQWQGKVIDRKKDGSFYPAMLTISPVCSQSADLPRFSFSHFVVTLSDLTKLEEMERQFHQAQKMEAIGTLVGGIAHDFNNMLAGMTGNLYLAMEDALELPDVVQRLETMESLSFRAADMIQKLLTFARKDMVSLNPLAFTQLTMEVLEFLCTTLPSNIDIRKDICSEPLYINGDATQLHQILMNLVNNARDAVEAVENPCITIVLETFLADEAFIESRAYFKAGRYAHLSVKDSGCGIPQNQIKNLFDPFFTTKEVGKGTGLGLSMVFGAIKTHHGFVEVDSIEGEGSSFHIYIPLLHTDEIELIPPQKQEVARGHGELILLVDDEPQIIMTGREVLGSLGYSVLTASNGQQAVEIFKAGSEEIKLCIIDAIMPIMAGDKAAQLIRQINPLVKIIFSTGYDRSILTGIADETVITKPYTIGDMSRLIRKQLNS